MTYEESTVLAFSITLASIVLIVLITFIVLVCVYGKMYDKAKIVEFDEKTEVPEIKPYQEVAVTENENSQEEKKELPKLKSFKD